MYTYFSIEKTCDDFLKIKLMSIIHLYRRITRGAVDACHKA